MWTCVRHDASDRIKKTTSLGKTRMACPRDGRGTAGIRSGAETRRRERLFARFFSFLSRAARRGAESARSLASRDSENARTFSTSRLHSLGQSPRRRLLDTRGRSLRFKQNTRASAPASRASATSSRAVATCARRRRRLRARRSAPGRRRDRTSSRAKEPMSDAFDDDILTSSSMGITGSGRWNRPSAAGSVALVFS